MARHAIHISDKSLSADERSMSIQYISNMIHMPYLEAVDSGEDSEYQRDLVPPEDGDETMVVVFVVTLKAIDTVSRLKYRILLKRIELLSMDGAEAKIRDLEGETAGASSGALKLSL